MPRIMFEAELGTLWRVLALAAIVLSSNIALPAELLAQDRWLVVYADQLGTIKLDTTRVVPTRPGMWRIWQRNSSDNLDLLELDCRTLRVRGIQSEQPVGPNEKRLVTFSDTTVWIELSPESRGEAGARGACAYLLARPR